MERGGSIELTIASESAPKGSESIAADTGPETGTDLIWRVKILEIRSDAIVVEQPAGFGSSFRLRPGLNLIGAMTIGQNRRSWT